MTEWMHYHIEQVRLERALRNRVNLEITAWDQPGPTKSRRVGDFVNELTQKEGKTFEKIEKVFLFTFVLLRLLILLYQ
jgi:cell division protein FtsL